MVVGLQVPSHLNDEQRRLLKEFAAASGESLTPDERNIFEKLKGAFPHKS